MHGVIFTGLKKYAVDKLGPQSWEKLQAAANLPNKIYLPTGHYPDADALALVSAAADLADTPLDALLEDFGAFITPDLVVMYRSLIRPEWRLLDLIERTEETIHTAVRLRNPGADPPQLQITRVSPTEIEIIYSSARRMCGIGRGIITGLARHYREPVQVSEPKCMLRGAPQCHISVTQRR